MPQSKSAQKQVRAAAGRRLRNKSARSVAKTSITKTEKLVLSGELDQAEQTMVSAVSSLDKAAEKGIIHPNSAARRKSRLAKKLNAARASAKTE